MPTVFLNGTFFDGAEKGAASAVGGAAAVSAFDAGFQHGVGLFETMLGGVREGASGDEAVWVMDLEAHLARLAGSARALGLSESLRERALGEAVIETVRRSGLARARVRLTVTGGDLNMLARGGTSGSARGGAGTGVDPTVLIVAQRATEYPAAMMERGVSVVVADARANPLNPFEGHKTLNYWWRLRELQSAAAKGAGEALVLSVSNHVCGGCVSNVLLVRGDEVVTPIGRGEEGAGEGIKGSRDRGIEEGKDEEGREIAPTAALAAGGKGRRKGAFLASPVLPGVTRAWALERAAEMGLGVRREMVSVAEVLEADEVLLTNSSWGVLPVVRVEANEVGGGTPGRVGREMVRRWVERIG